MIRTTKVTEKHTFTLRPTSYQDSNHYFNALTHNPIRVLAYRAVGLRGLPDKNHTKRASKKRTSLEDGASPR
jgi:hypothetical protein